LPSQHQLRKIGAFPLLYRFLADDMTFEIQARTLQVFLNLSVFQNLNENILRELGLLKRLPVLLMKNIDVQAGPKGTDLLQQQKKETEENESEPTEIEEEKGKRKPQGEAEETTTQQQEKEEKDEKDEKDEKESKEKTSIKRVLGEDELEVKILSLKVLRNLVSCPDDTNAKALLKKDMIGKCLSVLGISDTLTQRSLELVVSLISTPTAVPSLTRFHLFKLLDVLYSDFLTDSLSEVCLKSLRLLLPSFPDDQLLTLVSPHLKTIAQLGASSHSSLAAEAGLTLAALHEKFQTFGRLSQA
jgi:hypothetical protein